MTYTMIIHDIEQILDIPPKHNSGCRRGKYLKTKNGAILWLKQFLLCVTSLIYNDQFNMGPSLRT